MPLEYGPEAVLGFSSHIWLFAVLESDPRCIAIGFSSCSPAFSRSMESIAFHKSRVIHSTP